MIKFRKVFITHNSGIPLLIKIAVQVQFNLDQAMNTQRGGKRYSSTLSLTSTLDRGRGVVNAMPQPLYPRERPGTHCTGGWVGRTAGLDGCGKSHP